MDYNFLTVEEIAEILKVTKMTIYRYIKSGKIKPNRIGKDFRIAKSEFERFIKETRGK